MKTTQAVAAMILIAQTAAAAQVEAAWKKYKGHEGAFTIEMPARPSYEKDVQTSAAGTPYTTHTYNAVMSNEDTFTASAKTFPADMKVDPGQMLKIILAADEEFFGGGKWKGTWMKHQGFPAAESAGTVGGLVIRTRFVIRGQQLFTVRYGGTDGAAAPEADVDRFMNSLVIN